MTFGFKLYRITTALSLVISGLFTFSLLSSIPMVGFNFFSLLFLVTIGACFVHSILSIYFQRHLMMPEIPMKNNFPKRLKRAGIVGLVGVFLLVFAGILMLLVSREQMTEIVAMQPPEQRERVSYDMVKTLGTVLFLTGVLFTINIDLSFRFLKEWRQQNGDGHNVD